MQSRTSYFNKAIFLNTLKRFWPLWLAYLGVWLLVLPVTQAVNWLGKTYTVQRDVLEIAQGGGIVIGAVYGVLAAMAVWSFMYNSKTMSGVACLPVRREGVFLSASLAGLLPAIVSNIVVFALAMLVHFVRGYSAAIAYDALGFAVVTMMLVFFYGFATLCAQLTGNLVTLPAVYLVLNFTAYVVEFISISILDVVMYGVNFNGNGISMFLSPILGMIEGGPRTHEVYNAAFDEYTVSSVSYEGIPFLAVCCAVGIVMLIGALLLYRRRRMESVGDVVAVEVMKPVFKYCMTFGCALVSGIGFYGLIINNILVNPLYKTIAIVFFMLFGALIGYFAAEMLIHKSFRVFRGRWRGLLVSLGVICVLMLGMEFDLPGIEKKVPEADEVDKVYVIGSDGVSYSERENIEAIIALHESVIENKAVHENGHGSGSTFEVHYYMKDGGYMDRTYWLRYNLLSDDREGLEDVETLENIQNSDEAIRWRKALPFAATEENVLGGSFRGVVTNEEMLTLNNEMTEDELIIINYYGYDEHYVRHQMSEAEKQQLLDEYMMYNDVKANYGQYTWNFSAEDMWELYTECILPDLEDGIIGKLWIVEDDDYFANVCSGRVSIDMWYYPDEATGRVQPGAEATIETPIPIATHNETGRAGYNFTITPTVGSRTAQWLEDHGVILHTVGDELDMYGGYEMYGKYN